jgi:hypothetical protein
MRRVLLVVPAFLLFCRPALAGPDLALEAELARSIVAAGEEVVITVTFVNRGDEAARYFEPLHADLTGFPEVRLVSVAEGRQYALHTAPFQTMVRRGLQGEVVELSPGGRKAYLHRRAAFVRIDPGTGAPLWMEPLPKLPPGEYEIRAAYEQGTNRLPYNTVGFRTIERTVEGLFVGRLMAKPLRLTVGGASDPMISARLESEAGGIVIVTFSNPRSEEFLFSGTLSLSIGSKMYGSGVALVPLPPREGGPGMAVGPASRREVRVDLTALGWQRTYRGRPDVTGLLDVVPRGIAYLKAEMKAADGRVTAAALGIWIRVPPVPQAGLEDLEVRAALPATVGPAAKEEVRLSVTLRNPGGKPILIAVPLRFPSRLVLRIEDATGRRSTGHSVTRTPGGLDALRPAAGEEHLVLAGGLSWDGDRFEPAPGPKREDFLVLTPGEELTRTLPLERLLAGGLPAGRWRITAGYRSVESGARLGLPPGDRSGTGVVWAEPVEVVISAR